MAMSDNRKTIFVVCGLIAAMLVIYFVFAPKGPPPATITDARLRDLEEAVMQWARENGSPPEKLSDLGLNEELLADHIGNPFIYHAEGSKVTISSLGADGRPGGVMFKADRSVSFDCRVQ